MRKFSTFADLLHQDLLEAAIRESRYMSASSLPRDERIANRPSRPRYRRNKVLRRIRDLKLLQTLVRHAATERFDVYE